VPTAAMPLLLLLLALSAAQQQWASAAAAASALPHTATGDYDAASDALARAAFPQKQLLQANAGPAPNQTELTMDANGNYSAAGVSYNNPADFPVPAGYE